ncbi:DUF4398 domain-containing protein [Limisalsivibrio acetivorans]|uniref:DUF4398 domain-containing protein n=1 Tax=Limisalsivibrio acetivorans TaxID=1304888 RepID=UPI0003B39B20|nr:DUF4398 domain-containing protein [Limisalsivibrio acetivorans]
MRTSRLILLVVAFAAFIVAGCSKPPVEELDQAQAAMKAAQQSGAEKCMFPEYVQAKAALEEAQAKMDQAEQGGNKGELYEEAKAELLKAIEDFEKAKAKADAYQEVDKKVRAELEALKQNLLAHKEKGNEYDLKSYNKAQENYKKAQKLAADCEGEKALALIDEANMALKNVEDEYAEKRAEEILRQQEMYRKEQQDKAKEMEKYTVVKGDCLWNIAKSKYMNPFMWPVIYWANESIINDPDLIFPGQVFDIMKNVASDKKAKAEDFAKNRGPWSLFDGK